ncbi:MAG: ECF transporter S component [Actinobacteria bacterium]|uniref:Unannotated protein n=1 Tax=freshwater metagenome TaxID=449393 RepID=A0A6J6MNI3_9ZZZZ|nr:ECF transporter S component [Actinomycetota bacterium]MTA50484.1 ECF transporter S component [Actinomycetota bacterium]
MNQRNFALLLVGTIGLGAFTWPLFISSASQVQNSGHWLFLLLLPLVLAVGISAISHDRIDVRAVALLGVLIAFATALRTIGAGQAGIEPIWLPILLGARVFGREFAFLLGTLSLFASALMTGGVGPWLPYQMLAGAAVAVGAASLPKCKGRREVFLLASYAVVASLAYGLFMDLQFWPWLGGDTSIAYVAGDSLTNNARHFFVFHASTGLAWDVPRAIFTAFLILTLGAPIMRALQRVNRRAAFITSERDFQRAEIL